MSIKEKIIDILYPELSSLARLDYEKVSGIADLISEILLSMPLEEKQEPSDTQMALTGFEGQFIVDKIRGYNQAIAELKAWRDQKLKELE